MDFRRLKMAKAPTNKMRKRMYFLLILMMVGGFGLLIFRLYQIQIQEGPAYQKMALDQQLRATTISAERGNIFDRNMKTLAASATVWTVFISPAQIENEAELELIADNLSAILDVDREKIIERGQKKSSYYEIIKSKIEKETADRVTEFILEHNIKSVNLEEDTKRYYPYGTLASTVLGFTGSENKGAYGLESYYDKVLAGTPGMVVSAKNAKGADLPFRYQQLYEPKDGNSVVLTIDEVVQHFLEKHLETAVVEHNVKNRAVGIVMNVKTGEILAMATKPDFDPNNYQAVGDAEIARELQKLKDAGDEEAYNAMLRQAQFDQWRNKAISDPYEPGSVFKIITSAMALDLEAVQPTGDYFYCPGYHIVAGRRKACWKTAGHGSIDFTQAVKFSCNPAFMMVGARVGAVNFYSYADNFGLLEPTKIDLPGEADSYFYPLSLLAKESGEELASSSFGQTFKITPIQMIAAAAAAVNGGKLLQPYVVKQVIDPEGNIISGTETVQKRQVISEETSKELASILEHVVADPDGSGVTPAFRVTASAERRAPRRSWTKKWTAKWLTGSPPF
jgi:stage V sporulation protein D (sporulation-specific penicillin-binding protein)